MLLHPKSIAIENEMLLSCQTTTFLSKNKRMLHSVLLHSTLCIITYRLPRQRMLDSGNLDWEVRLNSMKENAVLVACRRIYRS